jgi:hypothetical protein
MDKHTLGLATADLPRLCALLRRTHLDELPQLWSVVFGQMSLVGPRPALPTSVEPLDKGFETTRRSVRPGCTGLWQLSVASGDTATSAPRFDLFYIDNASLRLDLWILVRTIGWVLGLVKAIEISDIPEWTLGAGLLPEAERAAVAVASARGAQEDPYAASPAYTWVTEPAESARQVSDDYGIAGVDPALAPAAD